jgi:hypothetical protein
MICSKGGTSRMDDSCSSPPAREGRSEGSMGEEDGSEMIADD